MTFEQVMTVIAVAAGPVGIGLGWGLSELGESKRAKAAAKAQGKQERVDRAIRLLTAAARVEADGRSVVRAQYEQSAMVAAPNQAQLTSLVERLNLAMHNLDRLTLEAGLLGPEGLAEIGEALQEHGKLLASAATEMRLLRGETYRLQPKMAKAEDETFPAFEAAVIKAMGDVKALLDKDS